MKYSLYFFSSLFLASASLQSMEITKADFVFKQKERGFVGSLCYATDDRELVADFTTTADSNRTFIKHELLWANQMNNKGIPKDVINYILQIRYHQTMDINDPSLFSNTQHFTQVLTQSSSFPQDLKAEDFYKNMLMLNEKQAKTLYLLLPKEAAKPLKIESASIQFSQEIAKQIDSMPLSIKKGLSSFYENSYYINTSEPTFISACLGEGNTRRDNTSRLAKIAGFTVGGALVASGLYACSKVDNGEFKKGVVLEGVVAVAGGAVAGGVGVAAVAKGAVAGGAINIGIGVATGNNYATNAGLGIMAGGVIIDGSTAAGVGTASYIHNKFSPSNFDEKMAMSGFEKRSFLPELENRK